jgi:hypothetical protein
MGRRQTVDGRRAWARVAWLLFPVCCLLSTVCCFPQAKYRHDGRAVLPDPKYTPGATWTRTAGDVCGGFRTPTIRHVTPSEKRAVYAEYGAKQKPGICCEVDHLISLELGGSNDITNLWPQPYSQPGAREKDIIEGELHREVCQGLITLGEAQREIATDWYRVYQRLGK